MLGIHEILRAQDVKRWGIVRMSKQQSLAEHSFNVAMIARALAKAVNYDDEQLTKAALCHDLDEIVTGDIPTPFKVMARRQGTELNAIYKHATGRNLTQLEADLLKLADLVEAHWYVSEYGQGSHAREVEHSLFQQVMQFMCDAGFSDSEYCGPLTEVINTIRCGRHIIHE